MDRKFNILLVGSGPSIYSSTIKLLDNPNLDLTLVDNSDLTHLTDSNFDCFYDDKFINSSRLKSDEIFNSPSTIENKITKNFGGLSTVWGSAVHRYLDKERIVYKDLDIELNKYYSYFDQSEYFLTNDLDKQKNFINIDSDIQATRFIKNNPKSGNNFSYSRFLYNYEGEKSTKICSKCGSLEILCSVNSLWSTTKKLKELIDSNKIKYIPNHELVSFSETSDEIICRLKSHKDVNIEKKFDYIFIGAGAFGTSKILLRSKVVKNVLIQNSDAVSLPFLKQSTMSINRISHPLIFSNTEIEGKLLFSQIYFYSDNLLKIFFESKLINNAANISPLILKNLFGGLRIFIDPTISSKIKLKYSNGNISSEFISQDKKLVNRVLSRYFKSLRRSGIYPINFLKKELLYGESYHFGSQFSHSKTLDINNSNINGNVNGLKRTFVVDSSVLPSVNTGPITYTVMANSLRISEAFLKSINN
tara:strand:- start:4939 stop:6363 length:1425 start_codon:yes stop_codon:yes gene_type:complete